MSSYASRDALIQSFQTCFISGPPKSRATWALHRPGPTVSYCKPPTGAISILGSSIIDCAQSCCVVSIWSITDMKLSTDPQLGRTLAAKVSNLPSTTSTNDLGAVYSLCSSSPSSSLWAASWGYTPRSKKVTGLQWAMLSHWRVGSWRLELSSRALF
jgi:hypothetical protein